MKKLSPTDFETLIAPGKVIEKDGHGPKVIALPNDQYVKVFYHKSRWSSSHLISRAKQFANNAKKLARKGIISVEILDIFTQGYRDGIIYQGIPGNTARQVLEQKPQDEAFSQQLGSYIGKLHNLGIMFRSLHMGNIVQLPSGELGLIDISDMRVNLFGLNSWQRKRNFQHVFRYQQDKDSINIKYFISGYLSASTKEFKEPLHNILQEIKAKI